MIDEKSFRRPDFAGGIELRLADGGLWTMPMPGDHQGDSDRETIDLFVGPSWFRSDYEQALEAVCEAEDDSDLLRSELALAICLLRRNYELEPEELTTLLSFSDRDDLASMQREMRRIALVHLRAFRPARPTSPWSRDRQRFPTSPIGALSA